MNSTVRRLSGTSSGGRPERGDFREGLSYMGLSFGLMIGYVLTIGPVLFGTISLCSLADSRSIYQSWILPLVWWFFLGSVMIMAGLWACSRMRNWIAWAIRLSTFPRWRWPLLLAQLAALIAWFPWSNIESGMRAFFTVIAVVSGLVSLIILMVIERQTHRTRNQGATILAKASKL